MELGLVHWTKLIRVQVKYLTPLIEGYYKFCSKSVFHHGGIANKVENQSKSVFHDGGIANQVDNQSNIKL
jgi:hypothetical protein